MAIVLSIVVPLSNVSGGRMTSFDINEREFARIDDLPRENWLREA